jgi:capsid protein
MKTKQSKAPQIKTVKDAEKMRGELVKFYKGYLNENMAPSRLRKFNWTIPGVYERDIQRFDREQLIEGARQYVENFPIVSAIMQNQADHIVASGYTLSMLSKDKGWNKDIEARWHVAKNDLDIRGIRSWGQLNHMWQMRKPIDGDVGIYLYPNEDQKQFFVQTIEAERIRGEKFDYLDQGVLCDKFGRPYEYYVSPRPKDQQDWKSMYAQGVKIKAEDFILYAHYPGERADAVRGTSALLQNFNLFRDIVEVIGAVIQKVKNEAFMALSITSDATYGDAMFGGLQTTKTGEDGAKRQTVKIVPGQAITMAPGEKFDLTGLKTPNAEFIPLIRFLLRYGGSAFGMPLEMLLLDVSETNFSGGRMLIELAKKRFRIEQDALARVDSRVFVRWLQFEVEHKKVKLPVKMLLGDANMHRWGRPSLPYYDPTKEAAANSVMLDKYLTSPQQILSDMGERSMEDVLDEWQEFKKQAAARKLPITYGNVNTRIVATEGSDSQIEPDAKGAPPK